LPRFCPNCGKPFPEEVNKYCPNCGTNISGYLEKNPILSKSEFENLVNKGLTLCNAGNFEEALASCDQALKIDPINPTLWNNKGNALRGLKRTDEALAAYTQAVVIDPLFGPAKEARELIIEKQKKTSTGPENAYESTLQANKPTDRLTSETSTVLQHVFLSYASEDMETANKLKNALEEEGLPVWIDQEGVLTGSWKERVIDGLKGSKVFVLVLTKHSLDSIPVHREISFAAKRGMEIIPTQFGPIKEEDFPDWYTLDYDELHRHNIDPNHFSEGIRKLAEAIRSTGIKKN
jgi:tetratricopeptide (TPR) repeat protein